MRASKYISVILILLLLPICVKAQLYKSVTERQAEQVGKRTYVTTSNDTTLIVNFISTGLKSPDTEFLKLNKSNAALDSLLNKSLDYTSEEAMLDLNNLILDLEREKKIVKGKNDGLSFRLASKKRDLRNQELEAKKLAESARANTPKELSTQELAALYLKYGDKPTYYINGVEVSQSTIDQLYSTDIISKDIRIKGTISNNPNGEVWVTVTEKGLNRIKLPNNSNAYQKENLSEYIEEVKRAEKMQKTQGFESIPVVRREVTKDGEQVDIQASSLDKEGNVVHGKGTRVLKRTVTTPGKETSNETERIPVQQKTSSTNIDKQKGSEENSGDTPKKSVRKIKEKQADQYKD